MKYNTVLRYGCARVRSVGLFALPYFNDLVKADLRHESNAPYTDYTHEKKKAVYGQNTRSYKSRKTDRQTAAGILPDMVQVQE